MDNAEFDPERMIENLEDVDNVGYTKYNSAHLPPHCLVCVFEGSHDKDYYGDRIKSICGEYVEVVCEGKSNVLSLYKRINEQDKNRYRLAYFVDHDFDPPTGNADIYETNVYSIENYYCTQTAFESYLGHIGLDPVNDLDDYNRAVAFYRKKMNMFHRVVRLFNCYYASVKKVERTEPNPMCHIKCFETFKFATINIDNIQTKEGYSLEGLNNKYGTAINILQVKEQLKRMCLDPARHYRGKYELQMMKLIMTTMVSQAVNSRVRKVDRVIQRTKPPLAISKCIDEGKFMEELTKYAETPQCLVDYLQKFVIE